MYTSTATPWNVAPAVAPIITSIVVASHATARVDWFGYNTAVYMYIAYR
jgi:hypothetical protein